MPEQPLPTMATFFLVNLSTERLMGAVVAVVGPGDGEGHETGLGSWGRPQRRHRKGNKETESTEKRLAHVKRSDLEQMAGTRGGEAVGATHGSCA